MKTKVVAQVARTAIEAHLLLQQRRAMFNERVARLGCRCGRGAGVEEEECWRVGRGGLSFRAVDRCRGAQVKEMNGRRVRLSRGFGG